MFETVTVDEAVKKGRKMVIYPTGLIIVVINAATILYSTQLFEPSGIVLEGFVASLLIAWFYRSRMRTKWKLWAFDNVRNVHELKKAAIREGILAKDNSFETRTEIRTTAEKDKWDTILEKFEKKDTFYEDASIPPETVICFSRKKTFGSLVLALMFCTYGIYLIAIKNLPMDGTMSLFFSAFWIYREFPRATNRTPQIILNDEGIGTYSAEFFEWKDISNADVIKEGLSSTRYYLSYDYPIGTEKKDITDLDISDDELVHLLNVYRGRYDEKNKKR